MKKYPCKEIAIYDDPRVTGELSALLKKTGTRGYIFGACRVLVCESEPGTGWHLSISNASRLPTWDEVKAARYEFLPKDKTFAMLLPPDEEYVNVHEYCFHLYEHVAPIL